MRKNVFVFVACGDRHLELFQVAARYLKRFSRQDILVVASRNTVPIDHDHVINAVVPEELNDHEASIYLKTSLPQIVGDRWSECCYLDNDVIAVSEEVDSIFEHKCGPVTFAADHIRMAGFSRYAVQCGCTHGECDHLRQAIRGAFDVHVAAPEWQHWNGGVFLFNSQSSEFMERWHAYTMQIFQDPYWHVRDQGTLIAVAWGMGLQRQPLLPSRFNLIVDRMEGMHRSKQAEAQPGEYRINRSYSLDASAPLPHPALLHFINAGVGREGWKNWDDVAKLLAERTDD